MEKITTLIIEDNQLNVKLVRSMLKLAQYQVLEAKDAEDVILLERESNFRTLF